MMRCLVAMVTVLALLCSTAFAQVSQFSVKDHLEVGIEANFLELDLDDVKLLDVNVPGFVNGQVQLYGHEYDLTQQVATIGYRLSDMLTPYAVLGLTDIDANIRVNGKLATPGPTYAGDLLEIPFDGSSAFTWGFGLKGDLVELPQAIILGYDVRMTACDDEQDLDLVVLPGSWGYRLGARSEIEYIQWDVLLTAKKTFLLGKDDENRKYFKAITPIVGFKFTNQTTETKLSTTIPVGPGVQVASEQNVVSNLYSFVGGAEVKITDNVSAKVMGSFGDVKGVSAGVTYKF